MVLGVPRAEALPSRVLMLRGLQHPNEKLAELLLCAPAARELGARELVLVSPYLAYMRQDMAFTPGEVVSQRHVAALLGIPLQRTVKSLALMGVDAEGAPQFVLALVRAVRLMEAGRAGKVRPSPLSSVSTADCAAARCSCLPVRR